MTLPTHTISGLFIASWLPPGLAQVAAFGSHYLLDAIPHWEKNKTRIRNNASLLGVISLFELFLSFGLYFWVMRAYGITIEFHYLSAGILAGLPDVGKVIDGKIIDLRLLLNKWPIKTFGWLHTRVHSWENGVYRQQNKGLPMFQAIFTAAVVINLVL
ncbi:MAG: hypothetical protein A3H02_02900 [Candidatus Niyogibacteria bacterium RIFCSPLOWO2_12_FULL_41_13]|uniref:DUF3307 domain-containing protein n=2 Tax=Parcubacteria group TaxID=1794811 RepID=A0A1G1Z492_9BACT|nr:MAG: hypothetical protein A3F24_00845 [Candidatus Colwellbacteria bacterium RIFCSPHIGHO2_12_FULL_44_17]OGZ32027.1 MAG: hypothetical protein A3H02_02900 [Candidatus Niyogibacteria bacterium RIFCSPLOWO2_12_FULL_41_13]